MDLPPRQPPTLRASDADRERVATLLRENYTDGRLTLDEFQQRLEQAYAAKTYGELEELTHDLPAPIAPPPPAEPPAPRTRKAFWAREEIMSFVTVSLFFIVLWALTGHHYFWPIWIIVPWACALAMREIHGGGRSRPRDRARHRRHKDRYRDQ